MQNGFLTGNLPLDLAVLAWFAAQLIKTLINLIRGQGLALRRVLGSGLCKGGADELRGLPGKVDVVVHTDQLITIAAVGEGICLRGAAAFSMNVKKSMFHQECSFQEYRSCCLVVG